MKIVTVVGTRPEIIKLSRIINKFDKYFDNILIHTGQNYDYELNEIFFKGLSIRKPNYFLNAAQKTPASFIGEVFKKIEPILLDEKPEAFFILGDTNSCLSAIVAKKHKIPIFHLEAGNRSFDERVPEEINRRIVDHISDINLTYSNISRECLVKEGISPERIIVVGSPLCEIHNHYKNKVRSSNILKKINVKKKKFFVFSIHREENVENIENLKKLNIIFKTLLDKYDYDIIVSTHPRTKSNLNKINIIKNKRLKFFKPFGFFDYVKLQINSYCVLSDSGSITEESAILNFPALNLREAHERHEGMEEGCVMMVGFNDKLILKCLDILKNQFVKSKNVLNKVNAYNVPNVSEKIVRIIPSYVDYVNKFIWKK
jgi:UDP-N-acetylglucosamine 2-epimerase (non-hydrolysing)